MHCACSRKWDSSSVTRHRAHTQNTANDVVLSNFWLFPLNWCWFRWFGSVNRSHAAPARTPKHRGWKTNDTKDICNTIKTSGKSFTHRSTPRQPSAKYTQWKWKWKWKRSHQTAVNCECDTPFVEIYTLIRMHKFCVWSQSWLKVMLQLRVRLCDTKSLNDSICLILGICHWIWLRAELDLKICSFLADGISSALPSLPISMASLSWWIISVRINSDKCIDGESGGSSYTLNYSSVQFCWLTMTMFVVCASVLCCLFGRQSTVVEANLDF